MLAIAASSSGSRSGSTRLPLLATGFGVSAVARLSVDPRHDWAVVRGVSPMALLRSWSFCRRACTGIGWHGGCSVFCALLTRSQQVSWFLGLFGIRWSAICQRPLVCLSNDRLQFHILPFSISHLLRRVLSTLQVLWSGFL